MNFVKFLKQINNFIKLKLKLLIWMVCFVGHCQFLDKNRDQKKNYT